MTPNPAARALTATDILALTLHHEAAGEGAEGMIAVGSVILNRAAWGRWGKTVSDVCLARRQFSCWAPDGGEANHRKLIEHANLIRVGRPPVEMARAFDIAHALLDGGQTDPTAGADHYYAPGSMVPRDRVPAWAVGETPTATIGRHIFFRLRGAA